MELGIDRFLFFGANSPSGPGSNPVPDLLEEVETADRAGLAVFGVGEHHTGEFADSATAVLLSAAAARTSHIRLSSAITILSVADPVRVMEDFSTLDMVSGGRAEIIVGRGAYAEAFSLFGADLGNYDALSAEKLDLLLQLRSGKPVHWRGAFRPPLTGQITYPRPIQPVLPIWVGATGSTETFVRAGTLGFAARSRCARWTHSSIASPSRPLSKCRRSRGPHPGQVEDRRLHDRLRRGDTGGGAFDLFPGYKAVFGALGAKAGMPPIDRQRFDTMTAPDQALIIGDSREVAQKMATIDHELGGVARVCLQMTVGPIARDSRLRSIELLGLIAC